MPEMHHDKLSSGWAYLCPSAGTARPVHALSSVSSLHHPNSFFLCVFLLSGGEGMTGVPQPAPWSKLAAQAVPLSLPFTIVLGPRSDLCETTLQPWLPGQNQEDAGVSEQSHAGAWFSYTRWQQPIVCTPLTLCTKPGVQPCCFPGR